MWISFLSTVQAHLIWIWRVGFDFVGIRRGWFDFIWIGGGLSWWSHSSAFLWSRLFHSDVVRHPAKNPGFPSKWKMLKKSRRCQHLESSRLSSLLVTFRVWARPSHGQWSGRSPWLVLALCFPETIMMMELSQVQSRACDDEKGQARWCKIHLVSGLTNSITVRQADRNTSSIFHLWSKNVIIKGKGAPIWPSCSPPMFPGPLDQ